MIHLKYVIIINSLLLDRSRCFVQDRWYILICK